MKRLFAILAGGLVLLGMARVNRARADAPAEKPSQAQKADPTATVPAAADTSNPPLALDTGTGCCNAESRFAPVLFIGLDDFRGVSNQVRQDSFGLRTGINLGVGLLDSWGVGAQAGVSYGGYKWDGQSFPTTEPSAWNSQVFMTGGLFKRADKGWRFNAAAVFDYMVSDNFSIVASEPSFGQFRGLLSVPVSGHDEIGSWVAVHESSSTQGLSAPFSPGTVTFQAIDQYNVFWKHWFDGGTVANLYFGFNGHQLNQGTQGTWVIGGGIEVPFSDRLALYGDFAYMRPSATTGDGAAFQNSYNISVGIAWYPCTCLRQRSICNRGWVPGLPVANNGSFFVGLAARQPPP